MRSTLVTQSPAPYRSPGLRNASPLAALARRLAQQGGRVEVELGQHEQRHEDRAGHEQARLDHLHPGGAAHAADGDVEDHQRADDHDRHVLRLALGHPEEGPGLADAQQQRDQRAGADHLGDEVEDRHRDGRDTGGHPDRALAHPERQHVAHRVAAGVAHQLGDQQQGDQPRDQEADRVEEAVVPEQRDQPGDAEERRGGHVVAADRQAVLEGRERPAGGVEVGGRLVLPAGPERDVQRDGDEDEEQADRQPAPRVGAGGEHGHVVHRVPPSSLPSSSVPCSSVRSSRATGSIRLLANLE